LTNEEIARLRAPARQHAGRPPIGAVAASLKSVYLDLELRQALAARVPSCAAAMMPGVMSGG